MPNIKRFELNISDSVHPNKKQIRIDLELLFEEKEIGKWFIGFGIYGVDGFNIDGSKKLQELINPLFWAERRGVLPLPENKKIISITSKTPKKSLLRKIKIISHEDNFILDEDKGKKIIKIQSSPFIGEPTFHLEPWPDELVAKVFIASIESKTFFQKISNQINITLDTKFIINKNDEDIS